MRPSQRDVSSWDALWVYIMRPSQRDVSSWDAFCFSVVSIWIHPYCQLKQNTWLTMEARCAIVDKKFKEKEL